jgi:Plasmid pRiA4b ORF-3-like protein
MVANPPVRRIKASAPIYVLKIELLYLKPTIWRRIAVPASIKLPKFHVVLLSAMGWMGGHLHEFVIGDRNFGLPDDDYPTPGLEREDRVTLSGALGSLRTLRYLYDFGDGWEHKIKVEKVLPADPSFKLPLCIDGANACPPEDVGGCPGYLEFLEAIRNPAHEAHRTMIDWCGGHFDPTAFDTSEVNARLQDIKL